MQHNQRRQSNPVPAPAYAASDPQSKCPESGSKRPVCTRRSRLPARLDAANGRPRGQMAVVAWGTPGSSSTARNQGPPGPAMRAGQ